MLCPVREIIQDILAWSDAGDSIAIATVIETWGSAPRTVGAKMAMTPAHRIAGSVSGGCVEGAVFDAGMDTLDSGRPQLLRYGVADETAFESVGLACGGTIEVFVEPLSPALREFWQRAFAADEAAVTATVIKGPEDFIGYKLMLYADGEATTGASDERFNEITPHMLTAAQFALREGVSTRVSLPSPVSGRNVPLGGGARGGGEPHTIELFIDVSLPRPTLIIVGAVHIAIALTTIAKTLGYRVVIVDPRTAFANAQRFPHADQIIAEYPQRVFDRLAITRSTAVVTLTHDAKFDDPALLAALQSDAFYVGALGGRKTRESRRQRLLQNGLSEAQLSRLHAPIGLPIGTKTPEEIALATMAQIVAEKRRG
jgi:xanthine dehydrogenase accessory factor